MSWTRFWGALVALSLLAGTLWGADVILNEYNAVSSAEFLNGGDSSVDELGGRAADSFFGRVQGNGGDWFELVVIKDHLDMRSWQLDIFEDGKLAKTLPLTAHPIWQDLRSGTIITVAEDFPSDISYDPAAGDWWINVQANDKADGLYIKAAAFPVSAGNWQLRIRNVANATVFGPAGEGIAPNAKVGGTEIFRLEAAPDVDITANHKDYDDGSDFSTFGAPNRWGVQDFNDLRTVVTAKPATIKLLAPNGAEVLTAGKATPVRWESTGINEDVLVEFSLDGGLSWSPVYPPNIGNSGTYRWLIPLVDAKEAYVRVSSATRPFVSDDSDKPFTILASTAVADLTGGGRLDLSDLVCLAATWLN